MIEALALVVMFALSLVLAVLGARAFLLGILQLMANSGAAARREAIPVPHSAPDSRPLSAIAVS